jgi:uncharacterized protein
MSRIFHESHRQLQDQFDTRRLADQVEERIVSDTISPERKSFIESMSMFFLATVDDHGHCNCSYKGGAPGFVRVVDKHTIAFPNYDGNGMYLSTGNLLQTGEVGLLFIDFENQKRMRFNGTATISSDDSLMAEYPEAQFIVRVRAREVFINCPRYIPKMKRVAHSRFVPKTECQTPIPEWKKNIPRDVLPANDPAHDESREILEK